MFHLQGASNIFYRVFRYPDLKVTNFTTSWTDGYAFNAIYHRYRFDNNSIIQFTYWDQNS